jgi:hypothetical protein
MGNNCNKIKKRDIIESCRYSKYNYNKVTKTQKEDIIIEPLNKYFYYNNIKYNRANIDCKFYTKKYEYACDKCNKIYHCRECHDKYEDHLIDIKSKIFCKYCKKIVNWKQNCENCKKSMGNHMCKECNIITDMDVFHCKKCKLCLTGKKTNFFHCDGCNTCLNLKLRGNHKCRKMERENDCYICLESTDLSPYKNMIFKRCLHIVHTKCFEDYRSHSNINKYELECGICRQKIF